MTKFKKGACPIQNMKLEQYLKKIVNSSDEGLENFGVGDNFAICLTGNVEDARKYFSNSKDYFYVSSDISWGISKQKYIQEENLSSVNIIDDSTPEMLSVRFKNDRKFDYKIQLNREIYIQADNSKFLRSVANNLAKISQEFILKNNLKYFIPRTYLYADRTKDMNNLVSSE